MDRLSYATCWWSAYSRIYDRLWAGPLTDRLADAVVQLCGPPGGLLVDVGCGTGLVSERLLDRGHRVLCVDPSTAMLRRLRSRIPAAAAVAGAVCAMPVQPGSARTVIATNLLHLVRRPAAGLAALAALLAPSGRLICSWPRDDVGPWRLIRAEASGGLSTAGALGRAAGRLAAGLSAPVSLRRTPSTELRDAVESVADRLGAAVAWIDLCAAEQTLAVIQPA